MKFQRTKTYRRMVSTLLLGIDQSFGCGVFYRVWSYYSNAIISWQFLSWLIFLKSRGFLSKLSTHPCPIDRNWVDSSKALDDSTQLARYVLTRFARSRVSQIIFWHDESTTGETIRVDSIESSRIDNIFNTPCIAHRKSRSVK